jgi:hypothetical protein
VVTPGEAERLEKGRRLAEGVRCQDSPPTFTRRRTDRHWLAEGTGIEPCPLAGDTGVRGRLDGSVTDVNSIWTSLGQQGRSGTSVVKQ